MRTSAILLALAAMTFAVTGCANSPPRSDTQDGMHMEMQHDDANMAGMHAATPLMSVKEAVAVVYPTKGNSVSGTIRFTETAGGLHIYGTISGLDPNSTHAMHIHEFGDQTSADGGSAGGHYNPEGHKHGAPGSGEHHAGDLGNIVADGSGVAKVDLTVPDISIGGQMGKDPIIGRGVVIHAKADDFGQPVGNAGGRIGVGVIGVAKPM